MEAATKIDSSFITQAIVQRLIPTGEATALSVGPAPKYKFDYMTALAPGGLAPDFTLESSEGGSVTLSAERGNPVILVFYPADWSAVCGDQVALYNEVLPLFQDYGARIFGVSVDGIWSHRAFAASRKLRYPLLADFEPKGAVARAYGVYRDHDGTSERALFVIDRAGVIAWSYVSPIDINPGADGILAALEGIATSEGKAAP